jgi:hypothetical protein
MRGICDGYYNGWGNLSDDTVMISDSNKNYEFGWSGGWPAEEGTFAIRGGVSVGGNLVDSFLASRYCFFSANLWWCAPPEY